MAENSRYSIYKKHETDKIWWVNFFDVIGYIYFSFDKEHFFSFYEDYPHKLTEEQREIFRKENPVLARLREDF